MVKCLNCSAANPEGSKFCLKCGFTLEWQPSQDPKTQAMPLELALEPAHARVVVGERVTVRVAGRLPPELATAEWALVGDAARFGRVGRQGDEVLAELHAGPGEQPRSVPLLLQAVTPAGPAATATGTLELLPAPTATPVPPPRPRARGNLIALVVGLVLVGLIGLAIALGNNDGDGDGGGGGGGDGETEESPSEEISATLAEGRDGVNIRSTPEDLSGANLVGRANAGDEFSITCVHNGWARIGDGQWIWFEFVAADGDPRDCEDDEIDR